MCMSNSSAFRLVINLFLCFRVLREGTGGGGREITDATASAARRLWTGSASDRGRAITQCTRFLARALTVLSLLRACMIYCLPHYVSLRAQGESVYSTVCALWGM